MNILITGGAGFVGKNFINKFGNKFNKIIVFDNLSINNQKISAQNLKFIKGDIRNTKELLKIKEKIDVIVHLAALVSVQKCEEDKNICYSNNVLGTENIFNFAKERKIQKIVYASSAAVYGNLSKKVSEKEICKPISEYGKSKLENEMTAKKFNASVNSIGLRFFNIYGPGLNMQNAYPSVLISFFKNIITQNKIFIFGDGKQTRDFIHVDDISKAIYLSIKSKQKGSMIYNVGTGKNTSIISLAKSIKKINPKIKIEYKKNNNFDIKKSCANINKIEKDLKFKAARKILRDISNIYKIYVKNN
jgi:UDP-glucose 4-epimerase